MNLRLTSLFLFVSATGIWAQGNFYNRGKLSIASGSETEVKGNVVLDRPVTGAGYFTLSGNAPQYLSGNDLSVDNFRMNSSSLAVPGTGLYVRQSADFQSGVLRLETYDLICDSGLMFTGGSNSAYIETPDSGNVVIPVYATDVWIPVGSQNTYYPVTLKENGVADTFYIRAFDVMPSNGQYTGSPVINNVALLSWNIQDKNTGGNQLDISVQWPDVRNSGTFNERFAVPLWYNGSAYTYADSCATDVRYTDPNILSFSHNTIGTFAIGDEVYLPYVPAFQIIPNTDTAFCDGGAVLYDAAPGAGYLWSNGANTSQVSITQSGMYAVSIQNSYGCWYTSDSVQVTVWPLPSASITRTDSTLTSSAADTYQWYLDGNPLSGGTSQSYNITQNGSYTVAVTNSFGCSALSAPLVVNDLGVGGDQEWGYSIGPNPSDGVFFIQLSQLPQAETILEVTDISGKRIQQINVQQQNTVISIQHSGVYFLSCKVSGIALFTQKLVVK